MKFDVPRVLGVFRYLSIVVLADLAASQVWAADCAHFAATVESLQGVVETRAAPAGLWRPVALHETLCPGDMVRTKQNSRASLRLSNNTLLRLDQNSTVTFPGEVAEDVSRLNVLGGVGHFISRVKRRFEVVTPFVNAAVDGTEFIVDVNAERGQVTVFEGRVTMANSRGRIALIAGQTAVARQDASPLIKAVVRPRDAVQWALYYPLLVDTEAVKSPVLQDALERSTELFGQGDVSAAIAALPDALNDPVVLTYRASLYLTVGRVAEARVDLADALVIDPQHGEAVALQAAISVVWNQPAEARRLAEQATRFSPQSAESWLALSYAQQASFDIPGAMAAVRQAVEVEPQSALSWARLAELHLSSGELKRAWRAAERAAALNPRLARTQSVLGFAQLARININDAREAFERAIALDSADPLARLGLGLARVRRGELPEGRAEIELAASLDPNNALIRSYLGKAHYEEKRNRVAASQLDMAKALDPLDPTPWFYDAIRKQTENRPVEAVQDLRTSMALNDNRMVYRSRLLLDEDLAARSASLARIYGDLGFQQLALVEGWKSLNSDPTNYSAHRFLADAYSILPRHEVGRLSELLQTQLWQPLNLHPLQPQLGESGLGIVDGAGPSQISFNEFNPLFMRDRVNLQANGIVAGNETWGNDLVVSGIQGPVSFSVGQFHYESEGFRENNDQQQDIYNFFVQVAVTPGTNLQAEYRVLDNDRGDLPLRFDPEDFSTSLREQWEAETLRFGLRHAFSRHSHMIVSLIGQDSSLTSQLTPIPVLSIGTTRDDDSYLAEIQQVFRTHGHQLIAGLGHFQSDRETVITQTLDLGFPVPPTPPEKDEEKAEHSNAYIYAQFSTPGHLSWLVGLSASNFDGSIAERKQINPKFGLTWTPTDMLTLRLAGFRVLERDLVNSQTVEPTHVAGFNQFYDDQSGTDSKRYGLALDTRLSPLISAGMELSHRDLDVPFKQNEDRGGAIQDADWRERLYRAYWYWAATRQLAIRVEYQYEELDYDSEIILSGVRELVTQRLPLGFSYMLPWGLSLDASATHIDQDGEFFDSVALAAWEGDDRFWVVDAKINYRLPLRHGIVSIGAENLFDENFQFQEPDPKHPTLYPERLAFARLTITF